MKKRIMKLMKFRYLSAAQKIAISFMFAILSGTFLLMLPIANEDGNFLNFIDALFTATSATCVTGLVIAPTPVQFSFFGEVVIICLIQVGGLGLMTLLASIMLRARRRLSLKNKIAMKEIYSHNNLVNIKTFLMGILKFTFTCELIGAVILMTQFIPEYGLSKGIFGSIFVAISAFCNAGFDNLTSDSLTIYINNQVVNYVVMSLIAIGGVGFVVWFDLKDKLMPFLKRKVSFRRFHQSLQLQTKMVIIMTIVLILIPALIIFTVEYNNPNTIGKLDIIGKITGSLFGSITLRTAGFATYDHGMLLPATTFMMIIAMFIGGSPGGTAGGVKTTTIMVIGVSIACAIRGKQNTHIFKRHISRPTIIRSLAILSINLCVLFIGVFILLLVEPFSLMEILFEAVSALATVGLTMGITPLLSSVGKLVLIMLMFVGRIGIMTFILSLIKVEGQKEIEYAEGHILIG